MKKIWLLFVLTIIFLSGLVSASYAELKLGGELRLRGVMVDNTDGTGSLKDGGYFEQRTRLSADASVDENAKVFIQIQDSRKWGEKTATVGTETSNTQITGRETDALSGKVLEAIDLSQGYIEIGKLFDQPLSVRLGRQILAYGDHRLIGSLEWSNNARRFDALKFMYKHDLFDVDLWTAKLNDETYADWGNDENLNGIYATLKSIPKNTVDLYLLQKIARSTTAKTTSDGNFYTIGGRVKGGVEDINLDYTAEIAKQTGDFSKTVDKDALAYAVRAGYILSQVKGLRIGAEYDAATGDKSSTANKHEAFDNLYPTNHYLYGYTDDVTWTNMKAWSVNAGLKPMDKMTLAVEYWNYTLDQKNSSGKDDNGTEKDIKASYELSKSITCEAAYVIRDAGDIATSPYDSATFGSLTLPANKSASFGYFMINVKFN